MKLKNKTCCCPLCLKEMSKSKIYQHFRNTCIHKNEISIYDFACLVESKNVIDNVISKYIEGYSLNDLKSSSVRKTLSDIPESVLTQIFTLRGIHVRNISESKTEITLKKTENTCEKIYGKGIKNVSQAPSIKQKKAKTFTANYGVDNIWKWKPFYDYVNDYMLKKYGKKRLSGWESLTDEERDKRSKKQAETRSINGQFDSLLEERVEKILTENNISHKRCFWLYHHPYDFIFGDHILLEVNGDYWHANPKIYKANDIMINGKTAKDIWEHDKKFKDCLQNSKFKLIYLWELDMKNMSDEEILKLIKSYL